MDALEKSASPCKGDHSSPNHQTDDLETSPKQTRAEPSVQCQEHLRINTGNSNDGDEIDRVYGSTTGSSDSASLTTDDWMAAIGDETEDISNQGLATMEDTRKDYFHFKEVPRSEMIMVNDETPTPAVLSTPGLTNSPEHQASDIGNHDELRKSLEASRCNANHQQNTGANYEYSVPNLVIADVDNSSSTGSSGTGSLTTDRGAAASIGPEDGFPDERSDYFHFPHVPRSQMTLVQAPGTEKPNIEIRNKQVGSGAKQNEPIIEKHTISGKGQGLKGSIPTRKVLKSSGSAGEGRTSLDTRKDYFHFNDVPRSEMILVNDNGEHSTYAHVAIKPPESTGCPRPKSTDLDKNYLKARDTPPINDHHHEDTGVKLEKDQYSHNNEIATVKDGSSTGSSDTASLTTDEWATANIKANDDALDDRSDYFHFPKVPRSQMTFVPSQRQENSPIAERKVTATPKKSILETPTTYRELQDLKEPNKTSQIFESTAVGSERDVTTVDTRPWAISTHSASIESAVPPKPHCSNLGKKEEYFKARDSSPRDVKIHLGSQGKSKNNGHKNSVQKSSPSHVSDRMDIRESLVHQIADLAPTDSEHAPKPHLHAPDRGNRIEPSPGKPHRKSGANRNPYTEIPQKPLSAKTTRRGEKSNIRATNGGSRSSADEHIYSCIEDADMDVDIVCLETLEEAPIDRIEGIELNAQGTSNQYEKLIIGGKRGCRVNGTLLRYIATAALVGVVVVVVLTWILREFRVLSWEHPMTTAKPLTTASYSTIFSSQVTEKPDFDILVAYVGRNASIHWEIDSTDPSHTSVCFNNIGENIFNVSQSRVDYGTVDMDERYSVVPINDSFTMVLLNVTKQDAGSYMCSQDERNFTYLVEVKGHFSRSNIGDNATLMWDFLDADANHPLKCEDNINHTMFHLLHFSTHNSAIDDPGNETKKIFRLFIDKDAAIFGFTLLNVTMEDAGEYTCKQAGQIITRGTVFIWGKPHRARVTQVGFKMRCDAISKSEPQNARPRMQYSWYRNNVKVEAERSKYYLPAPLEYWHKAGNNHYSCQGTEVDSPFSSGHSQAFFMSPEDIPKPNIDIHAVEVQAVYPTTTYKINCSVSELPRPLKLTLMIITNGSKTRQQAQESNGTSVQIDDTLIDCTESLMCLVSLADEFGVRSDVSSSTAASHEIICSPDVSDEGFTNSSITEKMKPYSRRLKQWLNF